MYEIIVNQKTSFRIEKKQEQLLLNDKLADWSCERLPDGSYSILYRDQSYRADILEVNRENKTCRIRVNDAYYELQLREPVDQVLRAMGLNEKRSHKVNQIKAPMPGMVLSIAVSAGQLIQKGDPVLVLEAMKMENVFKAPENAVVKEILVKEKSTVEKGQVLVVLE